LSAIFGKNVTNIKIHV